MTNRMRCLSSVSLPSPASMLAWDAATNYSELLHTAAGRFDRGLRAGGHADALALHCALDPSLLDVLCPHRARADQTGRLERVEIDHIGFQRAELVEQHLGRIARHLRAEADFRQTPLHRHLAAFEARLDLALAGARVLALVTAARGLAEAGADAAADAHAHFARALGGV